MLQLTWWNWNLCTNAFPNASFTPMNSFVPNNTIFLAGYPTFTMDDSPATCRSQTPTRTGTIPTGQQTIFFPLFNRCLFDVSDDWETGTCGITFPNETEQYRNDFANSDVMNVKNTTFVADLYLDIDGKNVTPLYLFDGAVKFFQSCEDDRTYKEYFELVGFPDGDTCDLEGFQKIDGDMDAYPSYGWWGVDTRTWVNGESHTFEFGSPVNCITAKYVLTAEGPDDKKCGLFGLGLFCPIEWLKWLLSLFS